MSDLGKTVLCANIIQFLKSDKQTTVLYHFCNDYRSNEINSLSVILRSFCYQLLQAQPDLCSYLYDEFIWKAQNATVQNILQALSAMLKGFDTVRMIVDGLDEWDPQGIKKILIELMGLTTEDIDENVTHKLLISSRDVAHISRILSKKPSIALSEEVRAVDAAIRAYAHAGIESLRSNMDNKVDYKILQDIENKIVKKAHGMFLILN